MHAMMSAFHQTVKVTAFRGIDSSGKSKEKERNIDK